MKRSLFFTLLISFANAEDTKNVWAIIYNNTGAKALFTAHGNYSQGAFWLDNNEYCRISRGMIGFSPENYYYIDANKEGTSIYQYNALYWKSDGIHLSSSDGRPDGMNYWQTVYLYSGSSSAKVYHYTSTLKLIDNYPAPKNTWLPPGNYDYKEANHISYVTTNLLSKHPIILGFADPATLVLKDPIDMKDIENSSSLNNCNFFRPFCYYDSRKIENQIILYKSVSPRSGNIKYIYSISAATSQPDNKCYATVKGVDIPSEPDLDGTCTWSENNWGDTLECNSNTKI